MHKQNSQYGKSSQGIYHFYAVFHDGNVEGLKERGKSPQGGGGQLVFRFHLSVCMNSASLLTARARCDTAFLPSGPISANVRPVSSTSKTGS